MRHRVIPARGRSRSFHVFGAEEARVAAIEYAAEHDMPVLICEAPESGLVRQVAVVKPPKRKAARR